MNKAILKNMLVRSLLGCNNAWIFLRCYLMVSLALGLLKTRGLSVHFIAK